MYFQFEYLFYFPDIPGVLSRAFKYFNTRNNNNNNNNNNNKVARLWNMRKVTVIPIVVGALGAISN